MRNFIKNRTFDICVNTSRSKLFPVSSSMPQGLYLAPLLYVLYVTDVVKIFKYAKLVLGAGDMFIYAIINNDVHKNALQCGFNILHVWCTM